MFGPCEAKNGTEINELLQAGVGGHQRVRQNGKTDLGLGGWQGSSQGGEKLEDRWTQEKNHEERTPRAQISCEMEGFMARKGLWNLATEKVLQDRGEWPKQEGDVIGAFQAMREEKFLSRWLRESGKNKEEIIEEIGKETQEETGKKRIREEEREENETVIVKRRCINSVSTEAFEFFCHGEMSESGGVSCGDLWDDPCGVSDFFWDWDEWACGACCD